MDRRKRALIALVVVAGALVPLSYVYGLLTHPEVRGDVWGGVPEGLRPLYIVSMLLAAAGFFPFTGWIVVRVDPERARVAGLGYGLFLWLYGLVLIPSALWMPLTFEMLAAPSPALWTAIRTVLFAVAVGSAGILVALLLLEPRERGGGFWLAVVGSVLFCLQTVVLDALLWPAYFPL